MVMTQEPRPTPELLPCPFCGGKATESQFLGETPWTRELKTWYRAYCVPCDFGMSEPINYEKLVSRWNARPVHTLTPEQVERARELIECADEADGFAPPRVGRLAVDLLREVVGDE